MLTSVPIKNSNSVSIRHRTMRLFLLVTILIHTHGFTIHQPNTLHKTTLHGKMWDALEIQPDTEHRWYLINCIVGTELELLSQIESQLPDIPPSDITRFSVPTKKAARSHGKRNVVDEVVLYPGYVFGKFRLCEEVYERIQECTLCRSFMGTIRKKGMKKLPSIPHALSQEEVDKFVGLETELEDSQETMDDLLQAYAGFEIGNMVKVLEGTHAGEDGVVRRFKNQKICVRLYTYGSSFDEWFDPKDIRPMTELEVMKGLQGPTAPIRQDEFNQSIGRPPRKRRDFQTDGVRRTFRSDLMGSVKGSRQPRNRRQDRVARGQGGKNMFGVSEEQLRQEEEAWDRYKKVQRGDSGQELYDVDSQWGRKKTSKELENALDGGDDWTQYTAPKSPRKKQRDEEDEDAFFNQLMEELSDNLPKDESTPETPSNKKQDFFSDLAKELSDAPPSKGDDFFDELENEMTASSSAPSPEDDLFATLEKEMTFSKPKPKPKRDDLPASFAPYTDDDDIEKPWGVIESDGATPLPKKKEDDIVTTSDDDFFSSLDFDELLTSTPEPQSSAASAKKKSKKPMEKENSDDDFFSALDLDELLTEQPSTPEEQQQKTTARSTKPKSTKKKELQPSSSGAQDLSKFTVPQLKEQLKAKGLKVSGRKAELIERLSQS